MMLYAGSVELIDFVAIRGLLGGKCCIYFVAFIYMLCPCLFPVCRNTAFPSEDAAAFYKLFFHCFWISHAAFLQRNIIHKDESLV